MRREAFERGVALLLGGLFVAAGALKAWDPAGFAADIFHYRLVPWSVAVGLSLYLPWLEVIAGGALLLGRGRRAGLWVVSALMAVFAGAALWAAVRGLDIGCGCFGGTQGEAQWRWVLGRDAVIFCACGFLHVRWRGRVD